MGDVAFTKSSSASTRGMGGGGMGGGPGPGGGGSMGGSTTSTTSSQSKGGTSYFSEFKKGEVNELLQWLQEASLERDMEKQREVIKRVIAYMTIGIDVSRLFPDMIMACNTRDLVQKKLVYLYLSTYARSHPDLSLLAVNTLIKDVTDTDPMIRGLALRYLCSLKLPHFKEYMIPSIDRGLLDVSPYVRKTAVMAVAKLFIIAPDYILKQSDYVEKLYEMLRDKDAQVVCNVVCALNEILKDEGGIVVNKKIAFHLLTRLKEFNEWSQCTILETILKYKPNEEDVYDILNLLDDRLQHNNSAVVFSVMKVFLHFTDELSIRDQVYERVKIPLLTVLSGAGNELAWVVLQHIQLLVSRAPSLFASEYKRFYCKYNDSFIVKSIKVDLLTEIANELNTHDIIDEFSEYARDVDVAVAKQSIRGIGKIGTSVPGVADHAMSVLLSFQEWEMPHVVSTTLVAMKDLLLRFPQKAHSVVPTMINHAKTLRGSAIDAEARATYVWMLGEYGEHIDDSPYLLEDQVEAYTDLQAVVKLQILSATMKLFFKKPGECQRILGKLFVKALDDSNDVDVHDRALFYYRLLQNNLSEAKRVVGMPKESIVTFIEDSANDINDRLFLEFNTFSVVYKLPASEFTQDETEGDGNAQGRNDEDEYSSDEDSEHSDGGGYTAPTGVSTSWQVPLQLRSKAALDANDFQQRWGGLKIGLTWDILISDPPAASQIESAMANEQVYCIASGTVKNQMKFYFYAQEDSTSAFFLVEVIINISAATLSAKFKSESDRSLAQFADHFKQAFGRVVTLRRLSVN